MVESAIILGVTQLVIEAVGITHAKLAVVVVNKDDKSTKLAVVNHSFLFAYIIFLVASGAQASGIGYDGFINKVLGHCGKHCSLLRATCGRVVGEHACRRQLFAHEGCIFPAPFVVDNGVAIYCGVEMIILISHKHQSQVLAIGLLNGHGCGISGLCTGNQCQHESHQ